MADGGGHHEQDLWIDGRIDETQDVGWRQVLDFMPVGVSFVEEIDGSLVRLRGLRRIETRLARTKAREFYLGGVDYLGISLRWGGRGSQGGQKMFLWK